MKPIQLPDWQIARLKSAAAILDATPDQLAAWLLRRLLAGEQLAQIVSEALGREEDDVRRAESLMVLGMWETWMEEDAVRQDELPAKRDHGLAALESDSRTGRLTTPA